MLSLPLNMLFFGVLVVACGAVGAAFVNSCVLETLRCTRDKVFTAPYKNFVESEKDLDKMCKKQLNFYKCLENVIAYHEMGNSEQVSRPLPPSMQQAKVLTSELYSKTSQWRKRYLAAAPCINRQHMDFCTSSEFLLLGFENRAVSPDNCFLRSKAVSCITATLTMNCDADAAYMFHYLLKMTADGTENCDTLGSEVLFPRHVFSINETKRETMYDDLYIGLMNRIGNIPEQNDGTALDDGRGATHEKLLDDAMNYMKCRIGNIPPGFEVCRASDDSTEEEMYDSHDLNGIGNLKQGDDTSSDDGTDTKRETYDDLYSGLMNRIGNIGEQDDGTASYPHVLEQFEERPSVVFLDRTGESVESQTEGTIVDAITIALDSLDDHSESEARSEHGNREAYPTEEKSQVHGFQRPIIINHHPFLHDADVKYMVTFKQGNGRISFYHRNRRYMSLHYMNCGFKDEMRRDFHCLIKTRSGDPYCLNFPRASNSERHIVPKDIDPEFGAPLYLTYPRMKYPFEQFLKWDEIVPGQIPGIPISDSFVFGPESPERSTETTSSQNANSIPVETAEKYTSPDYTSTLESVLAGINADFHGSGLSEDSTEGLEPTMYYASEEKSEDSNGMSDFTDSTVPNESVTLEYLTEAIASEAKIEEISSNSPEMKILGEDWIGMISRLNRKENVDFVRHESGDLDVYWRDVGKLKIESIVCGRVNECHPLAKYIYKCVYSYKYNKECVEGCKSGESAPSEATELSQIEDLDKETEINVAETVDYSTLFESSNLSEYLASTEDPVSTLYFADATYFENSNRDSIADPENPKRVEDLMQIHGFESTEQILNTGSPADESSAGIGTNVQFVLLQAESETSGAPEVYSIEMAESTAESENYAGLESDKDTFNAANSPLVFTLDGTVDTSENPNTSL